jgi:hypothetical protein
MHVNEEILAKKIKEMYVKEDKHDCVGVIGILPTAWWHIHDDEIVPDDVDIAIHIQYPHDTKERKV